MLWIFTFAFLIIPIKTLRTIDCNNGTSKLKTEEFILFQTPKYPKFYHYLDPDSFEPWGLTDYKATACKNTFVRSDKKQYLWFVFLNGDIENFYIDSKQIEMNKPEIKLNNMPSFFTYLSNSTKLFFKQPQKIFPLDFLSFNIKIEKWSGFQAFIYAPEFLNNTIINCPLNGKTFIFNDEREEEKLFPITSSFYYPNKKNFEENINISSETTKTCFWIFKLPTKEHKIKIHIKQMYFTLNQSLSLLFLKLNNKNETTTTSIIASLKEIGVYYFENGDDDDGDFKIIYNNNNQDSFLIAEEEEEFGFGGIVSAVKINSNLTKNNCVNTKNKFSSFNGYTDNTVCKKQVNLAKGETFYLHYQGYLEDGVDNLTAIDRHKNIFDITQASNWLVDETVTLKFASDGSVTQGGFIVSIEKLSCKCLENLNNFLSNCISEIPSGWDMIEIMDTQNSLYLGEYCGNMKCVNKIKYGNGCSNYSMTLIPHLRLREFSNDTVKLLKNGKLLFEINSKTKSINPIIFKHSDVITIDFESDSSTFGIYTIPLAKFEILMAKHITPIIINLTIEEFAYTLHLGGMNIGLIITINSPVEYNYTLDMHLLADREIKDYDALESCFLYDSNTTMNLVSNLSMLPFHSKRKYFKYYSSISGSLTLLINQPDNFKAFFRLKEIHSKNCESSDNVITPLDTPISFNALPTTTTGPCYLTILDNFKVEYSNFSTNSIENIKFVHGIDSNFVIFEFNFETASKWEKIFFYNIENSFIIPSNSTLNFTASLSDLCANYYTADRGIIYSYKMLNGDDNNKIELHPNTTCKLTAKFMDISSNVSITAFTDDDVVVIPGINIPVRIQTVIEEGYFVSISYQETNASKKGYVIEYEIVSSRTVMKKKLYIKFIFIIFLFNFYYYF